MGAVPSGAGYFHHVVAFGVLGGVNAGPMWRWDDFVEGELVAVVAFGAGYAVFPPVGFEDVFL